mgnify:CR=1 FL=1
MKIEIEISDNAEGTHAPYWLILDPVQNMSLDIRTLASQITGPFFSREEAETVLKAREHHYSNRATVYCHSGCYTQQYEEKYKKQYWERMEKEKGAQI